MSVTTATHPFGEVAVKPLVEDALWLEHSDPGTVPAGMTTNAYVVLNDDEALIFDGAFAFLLPTIAEIAAEGHRPAGLVLSHRHLVGTDDLFPSFREAFDAPVMLHPLDAAHPQAARSGARFDDPMGNSILGRFGVEAIHLRGQTEGSVLLWRERDGLLLAGDSAMGTTVAQAEQGLRHLVRPPFQTNVDEDNLREFWASLDLPVRHLAPLHGTPQIDQPDLPALMRTLARPETTGDLTGSTDGSGRA